MNIDEILSHFDGAKQVSENQFVARCPAHDDTNPSLYISEGDGGRILLDCKVGCKFKDIVSAVGLKETDFFKNKRQVRKKRAEREHIYHNKDGEILARKTIVSYEDGTKGCFWHHYSNGSYKSGLNGVKVPLYKLPELIRSEDTVFIVEGEKDVETMQRLRYTATSSPNGAGSKWSSKRFNSYLNGRDVVIISDNDNAGEKAAEEIAKAVYPVAKSLKVVPSANIMPGLKHKGDVSDIAEKVGDTEAKRLLDAAVQSAVFYMPTNELKGDLPNFIVEDKRGNRSVNPALLAKAFREKEHFKLVRDPLTNSANFYFYRNGVYAAVSDATLKGHIKRYITDFDESLLLMRDVDEVFKNLLSDLTFITHDKLDKNERIINFENGLLDLDTLELIEHTPECLSSVQLPLQWSAKPCDTPIFDDYLRTLTDGDKKKQRLLLEFIGAIFSNIRGYRFKKVLFLVGKGDTGKSQLRLLVERIIGSNNSCAVDLADIESRFGMANLYGKRLAGCADMSFMKVAQLKKLKLLTGGDSIDFERKGKDKFSARFNGLLWFGTNELPRFGGDRGQWVYDRFIIVECNNVISPEKQDKHLCDKMYAERAGIVRKALIALKQAIDNGYRFSIPESSKELLKEYAESNSPVISFFKECCIMRSEGVPKDNCSCRKMFDVFKAWCVDANNGYVAKKSEFKKEIAEYLNMTIDEITVRSNSDRFYIFTLTLDAKKEYSRAYGSDSIP